MRSPGPIAATTASLALVVLLALGSCSLVEPFTGDTDDRGGDPPDRSAPDDAGEERPEPPAEEAPPEPGYDALARGQQSAIRVPLARAIADPALWADFWAALTANQADPSARPEVDFDEETVVVLLLGERRTGGYAVDIARVIEHRTEVEVVVRVERPAAGEMVTQALTSPYLVASVPVAGKPVAFGGDDVEAGFEGD